VISDIVSDVAVPPHLRSNEQLWSGCISGAFTEAEFLEKFLNAGFCGVEIVDWQDRPWTIVDEIEFRSVTVRAFKPIAPGGDGTQQSVVYRGPWATVTDDEGLSLRRGVRTSVTNLNFARLMQEPYASAIIAVEAHGPDSREPSECCAAEPR
jgi:hypothetical protein